MRKVQQEVRPPSRVAPLLTPSPPQVHYWERLRFEIPYVALDITHHRERYRCLRENVMLVVREYNSILKALSPQERRLFAERSEKLPNPST